jgi:hypothetical protein
MEESDDMGMDVCQNKLSHICSIFYLRSIAIYIAGWRNIPPLESVDGFGLAGVITGGLM